MLKQGIARGAWFVTLTPVILSAGAIAAGLGGGGAGESGAGGARELRRQPPRVECPAPQTLYLRRFEDGSAQVLCARRVIVRISVPG